MKHRLLFLALALAVCCLLAIPEPTPAQVSGQLEIEAKAIPGQLDVLQGVAFQLGGTPPDSGPRPASYQWEILEGEGGKLLKADQAEAIFQAPVLDQKSMERFVVQLTATYQGQEPATAQLHVRVHKELPEKTAQQAESEEEIVQYMKSLSKKQRKKLAKQYRKQRRNQTAVMQSSPYPAWHFGFSWGWGWPVNYPIYVPIIVPPPGGEWLPGEGEWPEPTPLPYEEIVSEFPADLADNYLPQDFPLADELPGGGFFGDGPGDFYEPGFDEGFGPGAGDFGGGFDDMGAGFDDFGGGFDDFGGGFDDMGGGFDDFGW